MPRYALSALGVDRPGIVAAVSGALVELGCNLEDSTMTILQGHFAILLVVSAGTGVSAETLERALDPVARRFELVTSVRSIGEPEAPTATAADAEPWTIAVHGADRTGIVHGMCSTLAEAGGNVVDLATHLVGTSDAPVYVMTLRVTLPAGEAGVQGAERLRAAAEDLGVHCTVHPDDADAL